MIRPAESASKHNETKDERQFEPMTIHPHADAESDPDKKSRSKSSRHFNLWRIKKHDRHLLTKLSPLTKVLHSKLPKSRDSYVCNGRKRKLNKIQFECGIPWDAMFESLLLYRKEHWDTRVPIKYIDDSGYGLGNWVGNQRLLLPQKEK